MAKGGGSQHFWPRTTCLCTSSFRHMRTSVTGLNARHSWKFCLKCGCPHAASVQHCFYCNSRLTAEGLASRVSDPLIGLCCDPKGNDRWVYTIPSRPAPFAHPIKLLQLSRNTITIPYFYPVAHIHLACISKSAFKTVSQLTRGDISLLHQLRLKALSCLPSLLPPVLQRMGPLVDQFVATGFLSPSPFQPLHLHLCVPPFSNMEIFRSPHFLPLEYVLTSIETWGSVGSVTRGRSPQEIDAYSTRLSLGHAAVVKKLQSST